MILMAARTGKQLLEGLRNRPTSVSIDGRMMHDVTTDPATCGAAATLAEVFDRQFEFADDSGLSTALGEVSGAFMIGWRGG
jgi:aromatic ring hydroxylase